MENEKRNSGITNNMLVLFSKFEKSIFIILAGIIALVVMVAVLRIIDSFYHLFLQNFLNPGAIAFENFQDSFAKILTLLIALEFMNTIIHSIKYSEIRSLLLNVILVVGITVARKLIVLDYENIDPTSILSYSGMLIAISLSYFLLRKSFMSLRQEADKASK